MIPDATFRLRQWTRPARTTDTGVTVEFRILGPLDVRGDDGRPQRVDRRKPKVLLAILLLRQECRVPVETLVDALWGEVPPASARANLKSYVTAVRASLHGPARLVAERGGYRLLTDGTLVDASAFERLSAAGRRALRAGDPSAAWRLSGALALWRGRVLEDLPVPEMVLPEVARLEELRLAVLEDSITARLTQPADLPAELEALVHRHPLRERLWESLMLALCRTGRPAEALLAYERAAAVFAAEAGVAPGGGLRALRHRIITANPGTHRCVPECVPSAVRVAGKNPVTRGRS